jgi:hypothetical protein
MISLITKYYNLPKQEKHLLINTYITSIKVRFYIKFYKMPRYVHLLGSKSEKTVSNNFNEEIVKNIVKNVKIVSRNSFWRTKCFEEAFNTKLQLQKQGIKSTIYFGVKKNKENKLDAHSWLMIGNKCIIGCANIKQYTITEFFT